jgi:hypothetical protein
MVDLLDLIRNWDYVNTGLLFGVSMGDNAELFKKLADLFKLFLLLISFLLDSLWFILSSKNDPNFYPTFPLSVTDGYSSI